MARRRRNNDNGNFMMDIMTAAIGCLVLILIAVLIIILVANVVVHIGDPKNLDIAGHFKQYVTLTFEDIDQPFPQGNIKFTPFYIDVHHDKLVFYPGEEIMPVRDLRERENAFSRFLAVIQGQQTDSHLCYIVLLIRPYSARITNYLREEIKDTGIRLGYELFEAEKEVEFRMLSEMVEEQIPKAVKEATGRDI